MPEYEAIFTKAMEDPIEGRELASDETANTWYFAEVKDGIRLYKQS